MERAGAKVQMTPDERVRLGLPVKARLSVMSEGRMSEVRQERMRRAGGVGAHAEGVLLLSERVLHSVVAGQTTTIAMQAPFQVALTRWDEGLGDAQVELGVEVRQEGSAVAFCVVLPRDTVDDALPRQERAALCVEGAAFAALWPALCHFASFHGDDRAMRGVTLPEGLKGRTREQQERPARVERAMSPSALRFAWSEPPRRLGFKGIFAVGLSVAILGVIAMALVWILLGSGGPIWVALTEHRGGSAAFFAFVGGVIAAVVCYVFLKHDEEPFVGEVIATRTRLSVVPKVTAMMVAPPGWAEFDREMLGPKGVALSVVERGSLYALEPIEVETRGVEQLYVAPFRGPTPGQRHYALWGALRDQTRLPLVRRLRWHEAAYLEGELERFLSITDTPIQGEQAKPPTLFRA